MLKAIFYARFHPERGPSVIHQYPNGSVIAHDESEEPTLLSFSDIAAYIIPPYELRNRSLSICTEGYRVLAFPVSLENAKYERNRFTYNVCFVLDEKENARPYEQVVRKTAAFFSSMEEEDSLLQAEEDLDGLKWAGDEGYPTQHVGVVYSLLETLMKNLNAYGETCIRIDDIHVLNLRLTQPRIAPPRVRAWDVPLLIRPLPDPEEWTWDLTLRRIQQHIDGVNYVQRIAELADVELKLVKRAVRELLYHDRATLLDIFHFQAIYAPTADFAFFVRDEDMLQECVEYVTINPAEDATASAQDHRNLPPADTVINLYSSLTPGLPLHDFVLTHHTQLQCIDIRRLITFGIIKGFLRRIHKYALAITGTPAGSQPLSTSHSSPTKGKPKSNEDAVKEFDRAWKRAALSSGWATPPLEPPAPAAVAAAGAVVGSKGSKQSDEVKRSEEDDKLRQYLDGRHCLDEVCVAMRMSERKVVEGLRSERFGEVVLFNK